MRLVRKQFARADYEGLTSKAAENLKKRSELAQKS